MGTLEERRRYNATEGADERLERMVCEVTLGVPKEESATITSPEDDALWDRLAVDIAKIKAAGQMIWLGGSSQDE